MAVVPVWGAVLKEKAVQWTESWRREKLASSGRERAKKKEREKLLTVSLLRFFHRHVEKSIKLIALSSTRALQHHECKAFARLKFHLITEMGNWKNFIKKM